MSAPGSREVRKRAILITGSSTGIGRACALYLDSIGFHVFAGVRREIDGNDLRKNASEKLTRFSWTSPIQNPSIPP